MKEEGPGFPLYEHLYGGKVFFRYEGDGKMSLVKITSFDSPTPDRVLGFMQESAKKIVDHPDNANQEVYMRSAINGHNWALPEIAKGTAGMMNYLRYNFPPNLYPKYVNLNISLVPRDHIDGVRAVLEKFGSQIYYKAAENFMEDSWYINVPVEGDGALYGHGEFKEGKDVIDVLSSCESLSTIDQWVGSMGKETGARIHEHLDMLYDWFNTPDMVSRIREEPDGLLAEAVGMTLESAFSDLVMN